MIKINGKEVGVQTLLLDYTEQKVISISEYSKLLNKEISRVKLLTSDKIKWLFDNRRENFICKNDSITVLSNIGLTTSNCLFKAEIEIIRDILTTGTQLHYVSQYLWLSIKSKVSLYFDNERYINEEAP